MEVKDNQLLASCEKTFGDLLELLKKKNSDYAGEADTYKNFIDPELQAYLDKHKTGLDAVQLGIRIRMKDKWARLNTLLFSDKDPSVISESMDDTLSDIIGYAAIWKAWRENKKQPKPGSFIPVSNKEPLMYINHLKDSNTWPCVCGHTKEKHCHAFKCNCGMCTECQVDKCYRFELGN